MCVLRGKEDKPNYFFPIPSLTTSHRLWGVSAHAWIQRVHITRHTGLIIIRDHGQSDRISELRLDDDAPAHITQKNRALLMQGDEVIVVMVEVEIGREDMTKRGKY